MSSFSLASGGSATKATIAGAAAPTVFASRAAFCSMAALQG